MPGDAVYLPVHVGSVLSQQQLPYRRDDEGESISGKNGSYCELTGLYWAWRNGGPGPLGLAHYRRFFAGQVPGPAGTSILGAAETEELLGHADIVVARPRRYWVESVESHYRHAHVAHDLERARTVVAGGGQAITAAWDRVLTRRSMSPFNMFVARGAVADAYCGWLFDTLGQIEPLLDLEDRDPYQARALGFLGERLLNVWVEAQPGLRVVRLPVVHTEGDPVLAKGVRMLARKVRRAPRER